MRGYISKEYTKGKCTECGKYSDKRLNKKCPKCHWLAVYPIFKRWFMGFVEQERHKNMSQEEKDKFDKIEDDKEIEL